jgi:hypothetical protein
VVAFRRFAISVNLNAGGLNAGAYEGGHLPFPEYNGHRYGPVTGEGLGVYRLAAPRGDAGDPGAALCAADLTSMTMPPKLEAAGG